MYSYEDCFLLLYYRKLAHTNYVCASHRYRLSVGSTLVNHLKPGVGNQGLGYADAVGCLVVLQEGGDDAG